MTLLSNITNVLITILVFFTIILIHEMGHFLTAKAFGMKIYEFSIGMGPRLFSKRTKTTTWSFKLLPIGGAVQLGEDMESDDPNDFRNKPVWQRMIVIVAGAVMNLILGYIVCVVSICADSDIATNRISRFYDTSVSSQVMQTGDEIVEINGMPIWTTLDISYCLQNKALQFDETRGVATFDMTVIRGGERVKLTVPLTAVASNSKSGYSVVVDFMVSPEEKTVLTVPAAAARLFLTESRLIWISFYDLITGTYGLNDLSGPVGVVSTMATALGESFRIMSFSSFLTLVALITINLGIFNLLPIPALDGARFLFLLVEAIRRKPIPPEKEGWVHFIGFAALMLLMLVVTFNDIIKLFSPQ
ncbi:MAG: site-2 protease family protein [Ruminiclostridium sp.]|nr:site-2 protease family protein [Ruminiclostridium sp.]